MKLRRGISTALATVIIVAVALVISVAAAYYVISVVAPVYEKGAETLMIKGDSYITKNNSSYIAKIHMYSDIKPALVVYAVKIGPKYIKLNTSSATIISYSGGKAELTNKGLVLSPGADVWVELQLAGDLSIGNFIEIKAYTEIGYVYNSVLVFK